MGRAIQADFPAFDVSRSPRRSAPTSTDPTESRAREDDAALVAALKRRTTDRGDIFEALITRHQRGLTRHLVAMMKDPAAAEDIAQETFVKAYLKIDEYRGQGSFRGWLYRIATRLAQNHFRANATRARYESACSWPHAAPSISAQSDARQLLMSGFDRLSTSHREVLIDRHVRGLDVKEISAALGLGLSATKMRLMRAQRAFTTICQQLSSAQPSVSRGV